MTVHAIPRARRTALDGMHNGALRIRLAAPPADGAANDALVTFLAEALGVARSRVAIVRGAASRTKTVSVTGVTLGAVSRLTRDAREG